jgi:hypothetical protein
MFLSVAELRSLLLEEAKTKAEQGHDVEDVVRRLEGQEGGYDRLISLAERLAHAPLRAEWPYVEPDGLEEILAESDPDRPKGPLGSLDPAEASRRVEAAFHGSVCGCMLGKPLETRPSLAEIRTAAEPLGEWPLHDYVPEALLERLGRRHRSWRGTIRENMSCVAPDDDINYSLMGMLVLEGYGLEFTRDDLAGLWLRNLAPGWTFGPERTILLKIATRSLLQMLAGGAEGESPPFEDWVSRLNPRDEYCGAQIRADAYGYACAGFPEMAARLAWRDAGMTHRRTGVYATMFTAAAIACAPVVTDPLEIFATALKYVPRRSRFHECVAWCLDAVGRVGDWLEGYEAIHERYGDWGHCRIFQETGTLINTLRFAESIGHGIGLQVSQGNDTDSYGATAGSLLGAWFGPGHLEERWLEPFGDRIHTTLAEFHEQSLSAVVARMAELPRLASS